MPETMKVLALFYGFVFGCIFFTMPLIALGLGVAAKPMLCAVFAWCGGVLMTLSAAIFMSLHGRYYEERQRERKWRMNRELLSVLIISLAAGFCATASGEPTTLPRPKWDAKHGDTEEARSGKPAPPGHCYDCNGRLRVAGGIPDPCCRLDPRNLAFVPGPVPELVSGRSETTDQAIARLDMEVAALRVHIRKLNDTIEKLTFQARGGDKQTGHFYDPYTQTHVFTQEAPVTPNIVESIGK